MAKKAIKTECDGKWSQSQKASFIKSALRRASVRWSPMATAKREAKVAYNTYVCADCKKQFPSKQVRVDHTNPVVPISGFTDWQDYIERLFVEKDGYQVLCLDCHHTKSQTENAQRKAYKGLAIEYAVDNDYANSTQRL